MNPDPSLEQSMIVRSGPLVAWEERIGKFPIDGIWVRTCRFFNPPSSQVGRATSCPWQESTDLLHTSQKNTKIICKRFERLVQWVSVARV